MCGNVGERGGSHVPGASQSAWPSPHQTEPEGDERGCLSQSMSAHESHGTTARLVQHLFFLTQAMQCPAASQPFLFLIRARQSQTPQGTSLNVRCAVQCSAAAQ